MVPLGFAGVIWVATLGLGVELVPVLARFIIVEAIAAADAPEHPLVIGAVETPYRVRIC